MQIAVDLGAYAMMTGSHDLGPWLEDALAVPGADESPLRWIAVALAAMNAASSGGRTRTRSTRACSNWPSIAERLAETELVGRPLLGILRPAIAFFAGLPELTDRMLAEGLASDDPWTRAAARMFRANVAENNGDIAAMQADIELALDDFRALGERWGLANTLSGARHAADVAGRAGSGRGRDGRGARTDAAAELERGRDVLARPARRRGAAPR